MNPGRRVALPVLPTALANPSRAFAGAQGIKSSVNMDRKFFFDRYGLAQADVERYLSAALSAGGDFADLYFEYQTSTSVSLDESMVKSATQGISVGCGVRVLSGERTGYAYTDDLSPERFCMRPVPRR